MPDRPEPSSRATSLRWTVHPARHDPARTALLVLVVALCAALVWAGTGSPLFVVVGAGLLLASLRAWFLPRTYVLDDGGAREEGPLQACRSLPWSEVRAVTPDRHGVHLSPLHRRSAWLPDRGLFLRTSGDVESVLSFVRARRGAA